MTDDDEDGEQESVTIILEETVAAGASLLGLSWWKRRIPYISGVGLEEGEYIPQPEVQVTANSEWLRPKLYQLSVFAGEARWIVRLVAITLFLAIVLTGYRPGYLRVAVILLSPVLVLLSVLKFRVVAQVDTLSIDAEPFVSEEVVYSSDKDEEE